LTKFPQKRYSSLQSKNFTHQGIMNQIQLAVKPRNVVGGQHSKHLRDQKQVPGVIYGASTNRLLTINEPDFRVLFNKIRGISAIIELLEGSTKTLALVKAVQRNPRTDAFLHVDFLEISDTEEMAASMPVHVKGESLGVKNEGGILELLHHTLRIRCLPKHLPPYIEVNISDLMVGKSVHIKDLPKFTGVTYLQHDDTIIITCASPKVETAVSENADKTAATTAAVTTTTTAATATTATATKAPEKKPDAKKPAAKKPAAKK
jgi:large subunit ribosomal protein L25